MKAISFAGALTLATVAFADNSAAPPPLPLGLSPQLYQLTVPKPPTPAQVALGEKLFNDKRLSADDTVSCATCHDPAKAFADGKPQRGGHQEPGGPAQQPHRPQLPCSRPPSSGTAAPPRSRTRPSCPSSTPSRWAWPRPRRWSPRCAPSPSTATPSRSSTAASPPTTTSPAPSPRSSARRIAGNARFDRYLRGELEGAVRPGEARLGALQRQGPVQLVPRGQRRVAAVLGPEVPQHRRRRAQAGLRPAGHARPCASSGPETRSRSTGWRSRPSSPSWAASSSPGNENDIGGFKTPTLRNVGVTGPYMHDGSLATLWDVMDHYNKGGVANPYLDGGMQRLGLTEPEIDDLVAFLFALTSDDFAALEKKELAAQRARKNNAPGAGHRRRPREEGQPGRSRPQPRPQEPGRPWAVRAGARPRRSDMRKGVKSIETKHNEERDSFFDGLRKLDRALVHAAGRAVRRHRRGQGARHPAGLPAGQRRARRPHGPARSRSSPSRTSPTRISTSRSSTIGSCARCCARSTTSTAWIPQPDFVLYGGDLAQLGQKEELELGTQILKNLKAPVKMMVGEHDWFLDMGENWRGAVRRAAVLVRSQGRPLRHADEREREGLLDRARHDARCSACRRWPASTTACSRRFEVGAGRARVAQERIWRRCDKNTPLVVFSHSPLYKYYKHVELLDGRRGRGAGDPAAVQERHRHPRPHAPAADEPDRQHPLPRHAVDGVAVALRARGPARAHRAR